MPRGWIQKVLGIRGYRRMSDTYTLEAEGKHRTLRKWLGELASQGDVVLLLVHFPSTFLAIQEFLESHDLEIAILPEFLDRDVLLRQAVQSPPIPVLTLSSMLSPARYQADSRTKFPPLAIIELELSPIADLPQKILAFADEWPGKVRVTRLLSMADPMMRAVLGTFFARVMEELGMSREDEISSTMISRALRRTLVRRARHLAGPLDAESPEAWIAAHPEVSRGR